MKLTKSKLYKLINEAINEAWAVKSGTRIPTQKAGSSSLQATQYPNPGDAYKAYQNGVELHGWDKYAQIISDLYDAAPDSTSSGLEQFKQFQSKTASLHKPIEGIYDIEYVDRQPYASAKEMSDKMKETGKFEISSQFLQSDDPEEIKTNLQNRAVHDYYGHLRARGHEKDPSVIGEFSLIGELIAYNNQLKITSPKIVPLMFTLIVGQAAYFYYKGHFPKLKLSELPGVDYYNIGNIDGYEITPDNDLRKI